MITVLTEPKGYSEKAIATLKTLGPVLSWDQAEREGRIKDAGILVVKLGVRISKEVMDKMPKLKIIGTSTTGLNHIDTEEAERRGIAIASLRGETDFLRTIYPTAEETIGLIIMLMRNLHLGYRGVLEGKWLKEESYGHELHGKILGVIGFGRLGSMVARFGRVFNMRVIACDPNVSAEAMRQEGAEKAEMERVFRESDVVTIHVLHSPEIDHLITRELFQIMKPMAYFINTARGELIDEAALLEALEQKKIAGAALDVLENEDPKGEHIKNHPLVEYAKKNSNLIIVPHLGGATFESMSRTENFIAEKIIRFVRGGTETTLPRHAV